MRQSCKIINQIIGFIPGGQVKDYTLKGVVAPTRKSIQVSMIAMIDHFMFYNKGGMSVQKNIVYKAAEAPKGEFGVYVVSDGTTNPYRCKIRAPGFSHLQGIASMGFGALLADVITLIGTLDIVFGEVDR
jgi:NADH:ubiquinone oxidoreductase subunit D